MANQVFIQRSIFGRTVYILEKDVLEITSTVAKKSSTVTLPLNSVSPEYTVHSPRIMGLFLVPALLAAVVFSATHFIARLKIIPGIVIFYGVAFAAAGVVFAIKGLRPVEFFNFYDHSRRLLFSVVRSRSQNAECNDFVATLIDRLEEVDQGIPEEEAEKPSTPTKTSIALPVVEEESTSYWKLTFLAGVIGVVYPPIEAYSEHEGLYAFIVALLAATCAIAASIASISKREPQWYWSIIGVALSAAPFFIY